MSFDTLLKRSAPDETQWLTVSDLMAGLMMVFLFISVVMLRNVYIEREKINQVAISYQTNQVAIYTELMREFSDDLEAWGAKIDKDSLTFSFHTPDSMFATGKTQLSQSYQTILSDFFPRYLQVLMPFKSSIAEIRLEGHTSSVWMLSEDSGEAYFNNLQLSQKRTRSVLKFVSNLSSVEPFRGWMKSNIAAVGFSSSKPILDTSGEEDLAQSKRVVFRVMTNADIQIKNILERLDAF